MKNNELVMERTIQEFDTSKFYEGAAYYVERKAADDGFVGLLRFAQPNVLKFVKINPHPQTLNSIDCGDMVAIRCDEFLDERWEYKITLLVPEDEETKKRYLGEAEKEEDEFI